MNLDELRNTLASDATKNTGIYHMQIRNGQPYSNA